MTVTPFCVPDPTGLMGDVLTIVLKKWLTPAIMFPTEG
jgi:hypothetical protein